MKAVILARISTREQEQGLSIEAQTKQLKDYCLRNNLEVLKVYEIVESSTRGERKEFSQMIEFIRSQKETVVLVADAVDRFQRGFKESVLADELFRAEKIELHFVRENLILNKNSRGTDIMRWDYAVIGAKSYVLNISDNVKRTIEYKLGKGEWIGKAPVGYLNADDPITGKSTVILDKARTYLVKRAFELYATGNYSFGKLSKLLKKEGLTNNLPPHRPLSTSQIYNMIQNPFYYGFMKLKNRPGELYSHYYGNIIDEWLFNQCQQVRLNWHKKPFKYATKPFVFRGLRCAYCGCAASSDIKKGKYVYIRCTKSKGDCGAVRVREEVLLSQVQDLFKKLAVPEYALVELKEKLQTSHEAKQDFHNTSIEAIDREYQDIQKKLDVLLDMRIQQSITQDEYDKKATELKQRQYELNISKKQHTKADEDFAVTVSYLLDLSARAYKLFESSNVDQKRELINFVVSNLKLEGKKLLFDLKQPFDAIYSANIHSNWLPG